MENTESKWIKVSDRLPEEEGRYLVIAYGNIEILEFYLPNEWSDENYFVYPEDEVTHWQPLPERT